MFLRVSLTQRVHDLPSRASCPSLVSLLGAPRFDKKQMQKYFFCLRVPRKAEARQYGRRATLCAHATTHPYYSNMPAVATFAVVAPLAYTRGTERKSRRRLCVVGAKPRLVTTGAMNKATKSFDDQRVGASTREKKTPSAALLAFAAFATAILVAAAPARCVETLALATTRNPWDALVNRQMSSPGNKKTGLRRFGAKATAADETASVASTAVAIGLFLGLGASRGKK